MIDVTKIIAFEEGTATDAEILDLFSNLIKTGMAWRLQGFYGRTAMDMIDDGFITADGEITDKAREVLDA